MILERSWWDPSRMRTLRYIHFLSKLGGKTRDKERIHPQKSKIVLESINIKINTAELPQVQHTSPHSINIERNSSTVAGCQ